MEEIDMKKMTIAIDALQAETIIRDVEVASRGRRLRKAEAEVKDAAKPTSRSARLRDAEGQVKAAKPRDRRLCWNDMSTK
jgi:hypothetical protein